jgi:hypothetical protein
MSVSIAIACGALPAEAEDLSKDVKITWLAPAGCPDETALRSSIASLLREEAAKSRPDAPSFEAVVLRTNERFDLTLRIRSSSGDEQKLIHGETCATVADAFAVVVAFALDPNLAGRNATATVPSADGPTVEPRTSPTSAPPIALPPPNAPLSDPLPFALGVVGSVAYGTLPFPGLGLGGVIALGRSPRWELASSYWTNRRTTATLPAGDAFVDVRLFALRPSVCLSMWREGGVDFCPSMEVGRMAADSSGALTSRGSGQSWWLSPAAGVALDIPLARDAYVRARLDVGLPLLRPRFFIDRPAEQVETWRPLSVFGILSVEPELRISPKGAEPSGHTR